MSEFFRQTDLLVAAVNCWFPASDCAKEFGNKSLATPFPVVIFYPGKLNGVQYRGVLTAERIIRWQAGAGAGIISGAGDISGAGVLSGVGLVVLVVVVVVLVMAAAAVPGGAAGRQDQQTTGGTLELSS